MRAYLHFGALSLRRAIAYPFEVWSMLANNLIRLTLFFSVWSLLMQGSQDRPITLAYITAAYFMDAINFASFTWELPIQIRTGNIAMGLLKPISQPLRLLSEQWGEDIVYLAQSVPIYTVAWAFLPVPWPSPGRVVLFVVSALMGTVIYGLILLAVATVSFWTLRTNGTVWVVMVGWNVLSGKVVPLWFMPDWLRPITEWLPFSQAYYTPAAVLTGVLTGADLAWALARQALWVGLGALAVQLIWASAVKATMVQGG